MPHLSAETFAALQEFYKEQEDKELRLNSVENGEVESFDEDWVSG